MQIQAPSAREVWPPSRDEALRRMAAFVPRAGRSYAAERNYDHGPADRVNVSTLSPYIRHRLLTETEVLRAVLDRHSPSAAEKFVQEVFWRTYWKGWLEAHPAAWSRYWSTLAQCIAQLDAQPALRRAYDDAVGGRTGIDAFDAWAAELVGVNYLHNHARMWFASIWIFTLGLPWELGADFFMRNLLDGDPASNTLSWRWVAGLHTRGRTYTATRDNIRRYTAQRFELTSALTRFAAPLDDPPIALAPLPTLSTAILDAQPTLLVVHDDDLHGDLRDLPPAVRGVCALRATAGRTPLAPSAAVVAFSDAIGRNAVSRIAAATGATDLGLVSQTDAEDIGAALVAAAQCCAVTRIVAAFAPVGPVRDILEGLPAIVRACGLTYAEFGRSYDAVSWPAATRGFFHLRSRIPAILTELGIGAG